MLSNPNTCSFLFVNQTSVKVGWGGSLGLQLKCLFPLYLGNFSSHVHHPRQQYYFNSSGKHFIAFTFYFKNWQCLPPQSFLKVVVAWAIVESSTGMYKCNQHAWKLDGATAQGAYLGELVRRAEGGGYRGLRRLYDRVRGLSDMVTFTLDPGLVPDSRSASPHCPQRVRS